jgi:hypothetical protein
MKRGLDGCETTAEIRRRRDVIARLAIVDDGPHLAPNDR